MSDGLTDRRGGNDESDRLRGPYGASLGARVPLVRTLSGAIDAAQAPRKQHLVDTIESQLTVLDGQLSDVATGVEAFVHRMLGPAAVPPSAENIAKDAAPDTAARRLAVRLGALHGRAADLHRLAARLGEIG